jgi:hypothetical protein
VKQALFPDASNREGTAFTMNASVNAKNLCLTALLLLLTTLSVGAAETKALDIGDRNQVFIDGRFLETAEGVRIVACQPVKTNEKCLVGKLGGYSSLVEVRPDYRWYSALTKDGVHWRRTSGFAPAESGDILGIVFGGMTVFEDPKAPSDERFKMFNGMKNVISASSDGSDWRVLHENVFPKKACYPHGMDSHNVCYFDPGLDKYVAYVRVNKTYTCPPERVPYYAKIGEKRYGGKNKYGRRTIGRAVTDDLSKFPMPEVVLEPDDRDPNFGGVKVMDFYCPQVVRYPHAQDAHFLFNCRYRSYEDWYLSEDMSQYPKSAAGTYNCGVEDIELDASRDGISWERYDRRPWIPLGPEGSSDAQTMYMTRGMLLQGDEIWMYYIGLDDPHTGNPDVQNSYTLSRVVLRKDGFTCVEAPYDGGEFTTPPLTFSGNALSLNIDTSAMGLARVEIQDAAGKAIEGYSLDDCDRIHTANSTKRAVTWRGSPDVSALAGKAVRLRFELEFGTRLYSFQFGKAEEKALKKGEATTPRKN